MTLAQFEQQIASLASQNDADSIMALQELSRQIRTTLWNDAYKQQARALAVKADEEASQIGKRLGFSFVRPLPRFPSFVDSAGNLHSSVD